MFNRNQSLKQSINLDVNIVSNWRQHTFYITKLTFECMNRKYKRKNKQARPLLVRANLFQSNVHTHTIACIPCWPWIFLHLFPCCCYCCFCYKLWFQRRKKWLVIFENYFLNKMRLCERFQIILSEETIKAFVENL